MGHLSALHHPARATRRHHPVLGAHHALAHEPWRPHGVVTRVAHGHILGPHSPTRAPWHAPHPLHRHAHPGRAVTDHTLHGEAGWMWGFNPRVLSTAPGEVGQSLARLLRRDDPGQVELGDARRPRPHHLVEVGVAKPTLHVVELGPSRRVGLAHTPVIAPAVGHVAHPATHGAPFSLEAHWVAGESLWTGAIVRGERPLLGRRLSEGVRLASMRVSHASLGHHLRVSHAGVLGIGRDHHAVGHHARTHVGGIGRGHLWGHTVGERLGSHGVHAQWAQG